MAIDIFTYFRETQGLNLRGDAFSWDFTMFEQDTRRENQKSSKSLSMIKTLVLPLLNKSITNERYSIA